MSGEMAIVTVILVGLVLLVIASFAIGTYNRLHSLRQAVREARANIVVVLRKRLDLAARLVQIASNYGDHEQLVHLKMSADRAFATNNLSASGDAVRGMFALTSSYPELRASETYKELSQQLTALESEIQQRRERFNAVVRAFSTQRDSFPTILFASTLGIHPEPYFDSSVEGLDDVARVNESQVVAALRQGQVRSVPAPALPASARALADKRVTGGGATAEATLAERISPSTRAHVLLFTSGPRAGDRVPIRPEGMYIGRDATASAVIVEDDRISRRHLWIGVVDGRLKVRDAGSSNGTFLNNNAARVVEADVSCGDVVSLGENAAAFRLE